MANSTKRWQLRGLAPSALLPLTQAETIIGRDGALAGELSGSFYVARLHARITVRGEQVFIEDLGTLNHVFVNNQLLEQHSAQPLHDGDVIALGATKANNQYHPLAAYFILEQSS